MRYSASEKLEIIHTVECSHLPTKQTLDMLGIPRTTFYRWYDLYLEDGLEGLSDKAPCPKSVWNRILLENYYLPGDLEQQIAVFVDHYNNHRYHESLNNVTPADVYSGRAKDILRERKTIKKQTIQQRHLQHQKQAA